MKLTRAHVEAVIERGDTVVVTYRKTNFVARLLRWFENGRASHELNCLGGLDIVEETIGGGMRTNLYTYLLGNCDLVVKRVPKGLTDREKAIVVGYWLSLVGGGYGWGSIKRAFVSVPIRRFIKPRAPRLAKKLLFAARVLLGRQMPDCSASWVMGVRLVRPHILGGYDPEEVSPETVLRDSHLETVVKWEAPVFSDDGRP